MIYCWLTYNFVNLVSASKIPSGNFTSLFPRTLLSFQRTKNSFILKQGVYFTALVWWAETTKTVKSREEKNHFLSSLLSRLTLSSQSYLPFSSNKISHATEKCSIVKIISIITCWRSLPEPFVIFSCSGDYDTYISTYSSVRFPRLENRPEGRWTRLLLINCL